MFASNGRPRIHGSHDKVQEVAAVAVVAETSVPGSQKLSELVDDVLGETGSNAKPWVKTRIKHALLASGLRGVLKPDKTTGVRAEAEGDPTSLIDLYCLHESQKHRAVGAKLGADATGIVYGANKTN